MNTLHLGDNLSILCEIPSESVDLIYIDPPFNSNRNYSGMIKSKVANTQTPVHTDSPLEGGKATTPISPSKGSTLSKVGGFTNSLILAQFEDTWRGGMKTYIHEFMFPIVRELHRILKPTGSFYLHCDPTAQAYLQVEVLDPIFGISNFRNEIVWYYRRWSAAASTFQRMHDVIFWYSKSKDFLFTKPLQEYSNPDFIETTVRGFINGKIVRLKNEDGSFVQRKKENNGVLMHDVWTDINFIAPTAKERTGYPTQKPEKLLERIILASSNVGDTVLDCFMGSGTTLVVADKLERNFIGIDQSPVALAVTKSRLSLNQDLFNNTHETLIIRTKKWNYDELRKMDDFEFEKLMVTKLSGVLSKTGKGGDMGIDGIVNSKTVISVKRSLGIGRNVVDNLMTATRRHLRDSKSIMNAKENYTIKINKGEVNLADYDAILVAFSFGKGTYSEVVDMKVKDNFSILLLTVEDILPVAKPPKVRIEAINGQNNNSNLPLPNEENTLKSKLPLPRGQNEVLGVSKTGYYTFTAICETLEKVENYAWKIIDKKDSEIIDSTSLNKENTFEKALKKGNYQIICEVVDENGLSGKDEIEVVVS